MGSIQNFKQLFHENNTQALIREKTLQYNAIINQERRFGVLQARFFFIKNPLSIMIYMSYFVCNMIIEDENDYDLESLFNTSNEVYLK